MQDGSEIANGVGDLNGDVSINVTLTDVDAVFNQQTSEYALSKTRVEYTKAYSILNVPSEKPINWKAYDITGSVLGSGELNLSRGTYKLDVPNFGSSKIIFVRYYNNEFSFTAKYPSFYYGNDIIASAVNLNQKLSKVEDEIALEVVVTDDGYNQKDTTINILSDGFTVDLSLSQDRIPKVTSAQIQYMKIIGENLPDFPVHFVLGDKDSIYVSDGNGLVDFNFEDFNDPYLDRMKVYQDDPEDYSPEDKWMGRIIVKENQPDANMGQGDIAQNHGPTMNEFEDLYVNLDDISHAYNVAMKFTPRFGLLGDGTTIEDLKNPNIASMGARIGSLNRIWQKREVSPGVNSDTLYFFLYTHYEDDPDQETPEIILNYARSQIGLAQDLHENQQAGTKTLTTKLIEVTGDTDLRRTSRVDKYGLNYIDIFHRISGMAGNVLVQADNESWHHGYVILTNADGPGTVMSELAACLYGLKDGDMAVGAYFNTAPELVELCEFGKTWGTFKQESDGGVYVLPPPTP